MHVAFRNLAWVAIAGLSVTAAQAADPIKPNIKPGLWEVSMNPQVSGEMPISDEQLAKMPPEQRARFEAAIKSAMSKGAMARTYKECMTPEKIAKGFDVDKNGDDAKCVRKVISSSSTELTLHDECNKQEGKTVSDLHFQVKGGTQASGQVKVVSTSGSKTMTVNSTIEGKWLSASCGSIKDRELEKE